jgi:hypothetical protein
MKVVMLAVAALAFGSLGCGETEEVALNARLFDAQSMESAGGGCTLYVLGSGEKIESAFGNVDGSGLVVRERLIDDEVVIDVGRGTAILVTKRYGVPFFASGRVDEFTVMGDLTSGVLFRYWGKLHPNGPDGCAPLEDDAPR